MPPIYDLTLGGIALPTAEQDFQEVVGSDYELVGAVPMPGPPRPASMYNINIPIYGDQQESNPASVGNTKRLQVRSLLQNAATRLQGIQLTTTFDPDIDGYIVIGSASIAYAAGGPTFADYMLSIQNAALIPAQQTLSIHMLTVQDRRLANVPLDPKWNVLRASPLAAKAHARHYLPLGASDVIGQSSPDLPDLHAYKTIWGTAHYVEGRVNGEAVTFEQEFEDVGKGDVRIFEGTERLPTTLDETLDPELVGWARIYGPLWPRRLADVPILDNGVCRIRHLGEGKFAVETAGKDGYSETSTFSVGHPRFVRASVQSWGTERGVVVAIFAGESSRVELHIALQRGWPGPALDTYRQGNRSRRLKIDGEAHTEEEGSWQHARLGVTAEEALITTIGERRLRLY
jgi:hypothetical protein